MTWRKILLNGVAVVALLALLVPSQLLHQPIPFATVQSGSMVPYLDVGDIAIVLPKIGNILPGRVIVFKTETDVDWRVHRVVGGDAQQGFITKGDHNPETDQDSIGYPAITPALIAGFVPEIAGRPIKIPWLGYLFLSLRAYMPGSRVSLFLVVLAMALLLLSGNTDSRRRNPNLEDRIEQLTLLAFCSLLVAVLALGMSASSQKLQVPVPARGDVEQGMAALAPELMNQVLDTPHTIQNDGVVAMTMYVMSDRPYLKPDIAKFTLQPGDKHAIHILIDPALLPAQADTATLTVGGFLPIVPHPVTSKLMPVNLELALFVSALMPILPLALAVYFLMPVKGRRRLSGRNLERLERLRKLGY